MKYIRTVEGNIYERLFVDKCLNKGISIIVDGKIMPYKEEVIKTADTIEELCDVIIFTDKYGNHEIIYGDINQKRKRIEEIKSMGLNESDIFYGAIWTDKGLIYVAKMNEKGELELL